MTTIYKIFLKASSNFVANIFKKDPARTLIFTDPLNPSVNYSANSINLSGLYSSISNSSGFVIEYINKHISNCILWSAKVFI
jgi:hypothetical protein